MKPTPSKTSGRYAALATSKADQVAGSVDEASAPAGVYGTFVQRSSRCSYFHMTQFEHAVSSLGMSANTGG